MTKRCHHVYDSKDDYPDDMICQKCQTIWTITDYLKYNSIQLMTLPKGVRYAVVRRQVKQFKKDNPNYYSEVPFTDDGRDRRGNPPLP
jgi:hypothetical protein